MIVTDAVETGRWGGAAEMPTVGAVKEQVTAFACLRGMEDAPRRSLALALEEALTNVVRHAYPDDRLGEVVVDAATDGRHLSVRVADEGVGGAADRAAGIGTSIMRGASQRFEQGTGLSGRGTVVVMEFPMSAGRAA